ncbi:MAG: lipopolysaccharide biosynthesis protein [Dehalococcoidales bacterium]|nr:lipopolysaccharide biosynthesis protein [Dehalococcoidales bacterium]
MRQEQISEKITSSPAGIKTQVRSLFGTSILRNSIYLILNSIVPAVTGFVFWTVATRLYTTVEIGLASSAISIMTLLMLLSSLGLEVGLIRFMPESGSGTTEFLNTCFTVAGMVALVVSVVFVMGLNIWAPSLSNIRQDIVLPMVFVILTVTFAVYSLLHHTFVARRRTEFALIQTVVFSLLRFVPIILLSSYLHGFAIFVAWGIALIAAMISGFIMLRRVQPDYRPYFRVNTRMIRDMGHFSLSNYLANLLWMAPGLVLPLMVVNRLGAESGAYFYIGWAFAGIILLIPPAISLSLFAEGSNNQKNLSQNVTRSLKMTIVFVAPAIAVCFPLGEKALALFGKDYSSNSTQLLWLLAVAALPASINQVYFSVQRVRERVRSMIAINVFITVLTLALSYFLLPVMGIVGAGISYLLAQTIPAAAVSVWFINSKSMHVNDEDPVANR